MACSYYIYYQIDLTRTAEAQHLTQELLRTVATATGISGRVLKKRGEPGLWMEIYENVADDIGFESALARIEQKLDAGRYLQPGRQRHIECFEN